MNSLVSVCGSNLNNSQWILADFEIWVYLNIGTDRQYY